MPGLHMLRGKVKYCQGYTLIELLVGAAAASIFLAGTSFIVINAWRSEQRISGISEVQGELVQAMDFIQRDLNEAVFVYSDLAEPPPSPTDPPILDDDDSDGFVEGDGIPDLNQLIWNRGLMPDTTSTNRVPVLGFWKVESLSADCRPGGIFQPFVQQLTATLNTYVLVVYSHLRLVPSDTFDGASLIARAVIRPYDEQCTTLRFPFIDSTDPTGLVLPDPTNFYTWPDPVPSGAFTGVANVPLIDDIRFGNLVGAPSTTDVLPAPPCPAGYSYGGGDPAESPPVPDRGFYTCVSIPQGREPQDVQIFMTANSLRQADSLRYSQYRTRDFATLSPGELSEISRYINSLQSQLFIRGIVDRPE